MWKPRFNRLGLPSSPLQKRQMAVFNYGLDKVRFVTPVRCGDRVRLQLALASVEPKDDGQFLIKGKATLGD